MISVCMDKGAETEGGAQALNAFCEYTGIQSPAFEIDGLYR